MSSTDTLGDDEPTIVKHLATAYCRKGHTWPARYWDTPGTKDTRPHRAVEPSHCPTCGQKFDGLEPPRKVD
jgi:hypothetical protein